MDCLAFNLMMSLTDQWNRADCDAVLHKGGGGNGENIGGGGGGGGDIALPPSAAAAAGYAVIDLPSKLTSVPQSDTSRHPLMGLTSHVRYLLL